MINETLTKLLREVGTYQAAFKPLPLNTRPEECSLPAFTGSPITLNDSAPPDITKSCNYNYQPDTLYLEPFIPPTPCPEGLKVVDTVVKIFPVYNNETQYSEFTLKVKKAVDSACNYNISIPDIVIPCHPLGPQFTDEATITVRDKNDNSVTASTIKLEQDSGAVCQWRMVGDVVIDIPEIPCPDGLTFKTGQLILSSTCSTVPRETKLVKIKPTGNGSDPCTFDIQLPEITIPCYPNGPSFGGQSVITITDRGTTTDTQTIDVAHGHSCCDFNLNGDINLEIPCQDGIVFAPKTFKIISTGPSVVADTNKHLTVTKAADQCNFDIEFPDLKIPCYPDGPNVSGVVHFTVGNINHQYQHQDVSIAAVNGQTCQFHLGGDVVIPMPDYTIECQDLLFGGAVRVRLNSSAPWLASGNNSIGLHETQCGADLIGDLNLGLPNYVVNCGSLQFGGGINVIVNSGNGPTTIANSVALVPTSCGATLTGDIELTVPGFNFPCPNGYTVGGGITVNAGGTIIPANSANNSITLSKVHDSGNTPANECKVQLGGTLILPGSSGGSGFNYYNNWQSGFIYPAGSVVGQVHTEGGLCSYIATRLTRTNDKEPNADQQLWRTLGCEGSKRSHPFQLIKVAPVGNSTTDNWVKIIPDSKLVALGNEDLRLIRGLDTPFQLAKDEIVYLEAVYDNVGGTPIFHYAHVAKAVGHWDEDAIDPADPNGTIPHFYPIPYKRVTPVNATTVKNISTSQCSKFILKYADPADELAYRTAARNELDIILDHIIADNVRRRAPRFIKAYALIAKVVGIEDNDTSADFVINDGTNSFGVQQVLNHHVKEVADNDDDIPILTLRAIRPAGIKELPDLTANTITVPLNMTDELEFQIANVPALPGVPVPTIGIQDNQIHVYYTVNGTNPTINTLLQPGSYLYDPAAKPHIVELPTTIKAVAIHPLYRTSKMYVQLVQ
ncbi:MAG: hypothetical protein EBU46_00745 [Nitrosomonadaceae bacterium]|nr:hypothetical protein [Nitrosomonadaceae bacterium]